MISSLDSLLENRADLLAFVRRRVDDPDVAEDILQGALLRAFRGAEELRDEDRLRPWFYRILRNAVTDYYRRRATTAPPLPIDAAGQLEAETTGDSAFCECMGSLIHHLKPEQRDLIQALDLDEEPATIVAERLGITSGNLKVRRHRARQALRRLLEDACGLCAQHHCLDCTCASAPSA